MANLAKSLNCLAPWNSLIRSLCAGERYSIVLPHTTTCPICEQDSLVICQDYVLGGQWAHCRWCRFAGDMIELAATAWHLGIPNAIALLSARVLLETTPTAAEIFAYQEDHLNYRRSLRDFWARARNAPRSSSSRSVWRALGRLELATTAGREFWLERGGRFVGSASRREIEDVFFQCSHSVGDRANHHGRFSKRRGSGPGGRRLFRGRSRDEMLVVPFYDLPGRICGFLFIGREEAGDGGEFIFKRANLGHSSGSPREAGVGMLPALDDPPIPGVGDQVFVIADPVIGLMLQAQWLREHSTALPIVLSHLANDVKTLRLPDHLVGRKIIFWGQGSPILSQAKLWDAHVSRFVFSESEIARRLNHRGRSSGCG